MIVLYIIIREKSSYRCYAKHRLALILGNVGEMLNAAASSLALETVAVHLIVR